MFDRILRVNRVVNLLQNPEHREMWHATLTDLADQKNMHGLIAGRACRLLLDARVFDRAEATSRLERALSLRTFGVASIEDILQAAFWIEGFLKDSGLLILHDQRLWQLLDQWLISLESTQFMNILPLIRRTFASFNESTRQQLNQRVRNLQSDAPNQPMTAQEFDVAQADKVLPLVAQLLGLT